MTVRFKIFSKHLTTIPNFPHGSRNFWQGIWRNAHALGEKSDVGKLRPPLFTRKTIFTLLALLYAVGAILSTWNVIAHTQASTQAIEQILTTYNMKNEGEQAIDRYAHEHLLLGMFLSSPIKHEFELPSHEESTKALSSDLTHHLKTVRQESSVAAWWSWFLLNLSLSYVVTVRAALSFKIRIRIGYHGNRGSLRG
jgi:hypothetical protein